MTVNDAGNEVTVYLKDGTKKETVARLTEDALRAAIDKNSDINIADYNITRNEDSINISTKATGTGQTVGVTGVGGSFEAADLTAATPSMAATATSTGANTVRAYATGSVQFTLDGIQNEVLKSGIALTNTDYFNSGSLTNDGLNKYLAGSGLTIGNETIEFYNGAEGEYKGKADFAVDLNDITWATSGTTAATVGDLDALVAGIVTQIGDKMKSVELTDGGTQTLDIDARQAGAEGNVISITDGVTRPATDVVGSTFKATFQIGANQGQSMTIEIGDMRAQALNIVGKAGEVHTSVEGAKFTAANNVTDGTNNTNYIAALDVSSHETAIAAIKVSNNAIETVSGQRSNLGAFQNRLEHTISNLNNASENLQAAESRIRDVDMAKEVMEMTRANILGQASQAMLAQANQKPQSVLQLLG